MGRSHEALKKKTLTTCPQCKIAMRPHHACMACGYYQGRQVVKSRTVKKAAQKAKKERKEKEAAKKAKE
jgi:large subunit ribosomal protein L32